MLSELPMLENLNLFRCLNLQVVKIFGERLKTLIFWCCMHDDVFKSIELATLSLKNFIFTCQKMPCAIDMVGCHDL